jgi:hypothetical protein
MRFFIVASLLVGLAFGSPIGQVSDEQVTTSLPEILARSESLDATTVIVEILADEAVTSATQRARQAAGVEEEASDEEEQDATTVASGGNRIRATTKVPIPPANSSDFLAEYQYSSQFELGPKAAVELASPAIAPVPDVAPAVPADQLPVAQVVPSQPKPESVIIPVGQPLSNSNSGVSGVGVDEDEDVDSDEATDAPLARLQPQQSVEPQRVEESDSDNEITSDDVTTVKSFASEYEYTVQQLGNRVSKP